MDEKERAQMYVVRFIDDHGGPEQVAKNINMVRQTVRQIHTRRNYPGFDFISKMMTAYPDFDLKKAAEPISEQASDQPTYADDSHVESGDTLTETKVRPANARLLEFVDRNGGPSAVAKRIGKHPQIFYNLRDDKNGVSNDTLIEVWRAYPTTFDLMYVMTGQRQQTTPAGAVDPVLVVENQSLKRENESLQKTVDLLRDVVATQLSRDMSRNESKTESADRTTRYGQLGLNFTQLRTLSKHPFLFDVRNARPAKNVYTGRRP